MAALAETETSLLTELQSCPSCREELASVRNTLRLADDALRSVTPPEEFWSGYHQRLEQRLTATIEDKDRSAPWFAPVTSSVRVPLPFAIAFVLLLTATSAFSVSQYLRDVELPAPAISDTLGQSLVPSIVPLARQEIATEVVYVNRNRRHSIDDKNKPEAEQTPSDKTVAGLSGFKPTSEVKLTIIKGSTVDEK
jgi:hypothetical protein